MSDQIELALGDRHTGQANNLAAGQKSYRDDRHRVEVAVATLIRSGALFTADDVHRLVQHDGIDTGYDPNLVSSVLGNRARYGDIRRIDNARAISARRSRRASANSVWRGNQTRGDTPKTPSPRTGN